jgi:hypothetical protein
LPKNAKIENHRCEFNFRPFLAILAFLQSVPSVFIRGKGFLPALKFRRAHDQSRNRAVIWFLVRIIQLALGDLGIA